MTGVWAVTMVRDERDIIGHTLAHMASQGVTAIIVADNLSTDGTWEWLNDNADRFCCPVRLQRDEEPGYYQARKMTRLAHDAFAFGAEWVIPFDADEAWYDSSGADLATAVMTQGVHADCLQAQLHNYFPLSTDDPSEHSPLRRICHRDPKPAPLAKVAVRARADVGIEQGNHAATWASRPGRSLPSSLEVAHFPWRSAEQFERKARNGSAAYRQTDLSPDVGLHWRSYGHILESQGPDALRAVFEEWFLDPAQALEHKPAPIRGRSPDT